MRRKVKLEMEESDELFEPKDDFTFHDDSFAGGLMDGFSAVTKVIPFLLIGLLLLFILC